MSPSAGCHDSRERFSQLVDGALPAVERAVVEAHVAGCAECARELDRLSRTVALLGRIEPVRAPAGFVDRVLDGTGARTRPVGQIRRWARRLFLPLPVKLPLEAAAVALVAVGAVYVWQRTSEVERAILREHDRAARAPETIAPPAVLASPSPELAPPERPRAAPPAKGVPPRPPFAPRATVAPSPAPDPPSPPPPGAVASTPRPAEAPHAAPRTPGWRQEASPATPGAALSADAAAPEKLAAPSPEAARPDQAPKGAPSAESVARLRAKSGADAARDAGTGGVKESRELAKRVEPKSAPAAPSREAGGSPGRAAMRVLRPPDGAGRLSVGDRETALGALVELARRLGGAETHRWVEPDAIVVELSIPAARLADLEAGLSALGRWEPERMPAAPGATLSVEVRIAR